AAGRMSRDRGRPPGLRTIDIHGAANHSDSRLYFRRCHSSCWDFREVDTHMNLELRSILKAGEFRSERITLRVKARINLGDYLVAQTGWAGDGPSLEIYHAHWFPYEQAEPGDLVIIYTRKGVSSKKTLATEKTAHFFYWGLSQAIWDADFSGAVV